VGYTFRLATEESFNDYTNDILERLNY